MFYSLSRNNTEEIIAIFGEENQFCLVYFDLNNIGIFFLK
jgi:hypothetical protein